MKTCEVDGCAREFKAKGMCLMHYKRDRYGEFGVNGRPKVEKPQCSYCAQVAVARLMCNRHYRQWRATGDPLTADRNRAERDGPTYVDGKGYVRIRGKAALSEHRSITRATPGQVVHHVDGDKTNNDISNLSVLGGQSEHSRVHGSLERVAFELVRSGAIRYDHDTHVYFLATSAE
jgi:hypothetical protein